VLNYGKTRTASELVALAAEKNPLGKVNATVQLNQTRQTMRGFGGNFAQPRYGATEPMDAVGEYNLQNLRVVHARVGIPLNYWTPQPGVYKDEAQAAGGIPPNADDGQAQNSHYRLGVGRTAVDAARHD
jgi:hypothetical protein